ncbi:hypothetical protein EDD21DRAFT_415196 [Dissophora ornata]|nr:hypothetical protein EDD21DRAFT_415196 [Dissophora ornata]
MDGQDRTDSSQSCIHHCLHNSVPHGSDSAAQSTLQILAPVHSTSGSRTKALAVASRYLRHDRYQPLVSSASAVDWLQWLLQTAAVNPSDCVADNGLLEPMLMEPPLGHSARQVSCTSSNSNTITNLNTNTNTHSSSRSNQHSPLPSQHAGVSNAPCVSAPTSPALPTSFGRSNVAPSYSITTSARNTGDSEGTSPPSPSSSPSSPSSGRSDPAPKNSSSAYVGAGTSTSAFLYSTGQEFDQIWAQTTAFLHRTFSPTYRVGNLYLESWTNGTQRRGLERLKTSLLRGDSFLLVRNMTLQLKGLVTKGIADAREIERHTRGIEDEKRRRTQGNGHGQSHDHGKENNSPSTDINKSSNDISGNPNGNGNDKPRSS